MQYKEIVERSARVCSKLTSLWANGKEKPLPTLGESSQDQFFLLHPRNNVVISCQCFQVPKRGAATLQLPIGIFLLSFDSSGSKVHFLHRTIAFLNGWLSRSVGPEATFLNQSIAFRGCLLLRYF